MLSAKNKTVLEFICDYAAIECLVFASISSNECSSLSEVSLNSCLHELKAKGMPGNYVKPADNEYHTPAGAISETQKEVTSQVESIDI